MYVAGLRVRADDEARDAQPVAQLVDRGWDDVVVEAAPVIPGEEDRGAGPAGAAADLIDARRHVGLAAAERTRRMFSDLLAGRQPGDVRKSAASRSRDFVAEV